MPPPRILIAGIGNIFLGDDAFGCEVVRQLQRRKWPENVRVVDFGIRGFDLAYAILDGYDVTIFVDATPRGGAPGTLYTIEPDLSDLDRQDESVVFEGHSMDPVKVLRIARMMGGELKKILLVGCEPETFGPEEGLMGLSEAVQGAVPKALQIVESLVAQQLDPARGATGLEVKG